ncbi:MAG: ABC transporter substrate-binding protein [Thiolinea sp.]
MPVKKAFLVFWVLCVFQLLPVAINADDKASREKVIVYNWSEYIAEGVLEGFTKETGIEVEYSTYDNNEIMLARLEVLRGRGYDVVVPSTYMVKKMADEGLIQKIDKNKLENFSNLDPNLLNKSYDPDNKYSIPYLWGSTGIALDRNTYDGVKLEKWADLLDARWKNKLVMLDDMRDVFTIGLKAGGFSINSKDEDEISEAYFYLEKLTENVKLYSGNPQEEFLSKNADVGLIWNGDAVVAKEEISGIDFIYPKEGVSFWADNFVIPARAKNVWNAHKFIDYMLRPEVAALSTKDLGYATPNIVGKSLLDKEIRNNKTIFPPAEVVNMSEFQESVDDAREIYEIYWAKLKTIKK